jgi:hypothetical protein
LQEGGLEVGNDQNRDLYVADRDGRTELLFEAKTDVSTSSVYQAIGQLIFHSVTHEPQPKLVLVLPASPDVATNRVLDRLNIRVLAFQWEKDKPIFLNLQEVLR